MNESNLLKIFGLWGRWVGADSIKLLNLYHAQYIIVILSLVLKK